MANKIKMMMSFSLLLTLCSCSQGSELAVSFGASAATHTVVFHNYDGSVLKKEEVKDRCALTSVPKPNPIDNCDFVAWGNQYRSSVTLTNITKDLSLYPLFEFSDSSLNTMKEKQKTYKFINKSHYVNSFWSWLYALADKEIEQSFGTAFAFRQEGNYTYLFTCNHATEILSCSDSQKKLDYVEYIVEDQYGASYSASLIYTDTTYDISIVRMECTDPLYVFDLETNCTQYEPTLGIGHPAGIQEDYYATGYVTHNQTTNVTYGEYDYFGIRSTSPSYPGCSGGVLLNHDLNVIGMICAGSDDAEFEENNSTYSVSCPAKYLYQDAKEAGILS